MRTGRCVVAGHICLDIIPEIGNQANFLGSIQPGHLLAIGPPTMAPGGSVSNTGLALHKLGIETQLMSKLGNDSFGAELHARLAEREQSLTGGLRAVQGEHTSYSIILSPPDADRVFLHSTGANDTFGPEDVDYTALSKADIFQFGYPTAMARMVAADGVELAELLQRAKQTGITTSLDTSMFDPHGPFGDTNWRTLLARVLPYVDIFLPSLDEIMLMLYPGQVTQQANPGLCRSIAQLLIDFGTDIVVLKQGENGLYLRSAAQLRERDLGRAYANADTRWNERELWAPAFMVNTIGTTGAGDCAVGGFLAAVLRGLSPEEALSMAAATGACNVEAADATSGVRSWSATMERIEKGWVQRPLDLPGWNYDQAVRLWRGSDDVCG